MNETMDINLRVGYFGEQRLITPWGRVAPSTLPTQRFQNWETSADIILFPGGCLSVANLMTDLDDNSTEEEEAQINCIYGLRSTDTEDLGEELWEDLDLSGAAKSSVFEALNTTLPHAVHLQENACFWPPIVIHIATFFLSGLVLGVASTASSNKPSYKFILLVGGLLGAFALGLALTVAIASTSALNALLEGGRSQDESVRNDGAPFVIRRGNLLETFSGVLVAFVTLFYVAIGYLFIRRSK